MDIDFVVCKWNKVLDGRAEISTVSPKDLEIALEVINGRDDYLDEINEIEANHRAEVAALGDQINDLEDDVRTLENENEKLEIKIEEMNGKINSSDGKSSGSPFCQTKNF